MAVDKLPYYYGNHPEDAHPNLTARSMVRGHLNALLQVYLSKYVSAPTGRLVFDTEAQLPKVVGFNEKDLALQGLVFIADARAQAMKPLGRSAGRQAYLHYILDAAAIMTHTEGEDSMNLSTFTSNSPQRKRFRNELYDQVRAEIMPEAGIGAGYAAEVTLGDRTYPGIEIPLITNPDQIAVIRNELLVPRSTIT